jgi:hypothetical protein
MFKNPGTVDTAFSIYSPDMHHCTAASGLVDRAAS